MKSVSTKSDPDGLVIEAYALRSVGMLDEAIKRCFAAVSASDERNDTVLLTHEFLEETGDKKRAAEFLIPIVGRHTDNAKFAAALIPSCGTLLPQSGEKTFPTARRRSI